MKPRASADNMYWSNFLHIYQPPTQSEAIVRKVTAESYRPLVRILQEFPQAKVTLNINGCLTQQLAHSLAREQVLEVQRLAHDVMETARHWQDTGKARLLAKEFLDSHPQVVAKSLTFRPKEGVDW